MYRNLVRDCVDFGNYMHPYEQLVSHFTPDEHTATVCYQVLKAALASNALTSTMTTTAELKWPRVRNAIFGNSLKFSFWSGFDVS